MIRFADIKTVPQPTGLISSTSSTYNLSFIAASLRPELARIVAESYLATGDWNLAKERILSSNALQCPPMPEPKQRHPL